NHIKEADADLFASICVGTHMYQYFDKYVVCERSEELIRTYLSIIISSIFTYFLSFNEYHHKLYFESRTHPHPVVRLFYSLEVIVDYFTSVLNSKNIEVKVNQQQILTQTFQISEVMISKFFDETIVAHFKRLIIERGTEVINYKN